MISHSIVGILILPKFKTSFWPVMAQHKAPTERQVCQRMFYKINENNINYHLIYNADTCTKVISPLKYHSSLEYYRVNKSICSQDIFVPLAGSRNQIVSISRKAFIFCLLFLIRVIQLYEDCPVSMWDRLAETLKLEIRRSILKSILDCKKCTCTLLNIV